MRGTLDGRLRLMAGLYDVVGKPLIRILQRLHTTAPESHEVCTSICQDVVAEARLPSGGLHAPVRFYTMQNWPAAEETSEAYPAAAGSSHPSLWLTEVPTGFLQDRDGWL